MDLKIIVIVGKGSNKQNMLENEITCILYEHSYFGKIINILQILHSVCQKCSVYIYKYMSVNVSFTD